MTLFSKVIDKIPVQIFFFSLLVPVTMILSWLIQTELMWDWDWDRDWYNAKVQVQVPVPCEFQYEGSAYYTVTHSFLVPFKFCLNRPSGPPDSEHGKKPYLHSIIPVLAGGIVRCAPAFTRSLMTSWWLNRTASSSGVCPYRSRTWTEAPSSSRYSTTFRWPELAATCKAVRPS